MTYFAIQYRNMHNGIHHVMPCADKDYAQWLYDYIKDNDSLPDDHALDNIEDDFEIDFRDPPEEYKGELLDYITAHSDGRYDEHPDAL